MDSTINRNNLPSHKTRPGPRNKQNRISNLLGCTLPLINLMTPQNLANRSTLHSHIRSSRTGRNNIDSDALARQLAGHSSRHESQRSLGSSVHSQGRNAQLACDTADVDDAAAAGHVRKSGLDEEEWTSNVSAKDVVPSCCWYSGDFGVECCLACVVYDDVNCFGV